MFDHPMPGADASSPDLLARRRCPDCNSDVGLSVIAPRVLRLTIRHDNTCPTARGLLGGRS